MHNSKLTWNDMYQDYKQKYPVQARKAIGFEPYGYGKIVIWIKDEGKIIYDDDSGTISWLSTIDNKPILRKERPNKYPNGKRVIVVETGQEYRSIRECAKNIGGQKTSVHRCLSGTQESHKGYHFKYSDRN